jgi:hypothetical protein
MAKKRAKKKEQDANGVLIPAGLLIGIGVGFLLGNIPAWTLIGLGAGFLAMWFFRKK